ncbi:hypothetical protein [Streptomyces sp. NBC_01304]|uniref:hypothetical protein n=1 Tax=Streptomyces sp. NBC_01304 TaxID=2903818 RepID=UPI002E1313F5|nr:hypothetical protein OG430_45035 [Streptomyces sp. NBC_01304]
MGTLPDGIYRMSLDEQQRLTIMDEGSVVLLPAQDEGQEFEVRCSSGDDYSITMPTRIWPARYLCYDAAGAPPHKGDRVRLRVSEFPPCQWKITQGSRQGNFTIVVSGVDLTMGIAPVKVYPPWLELTSTADEGRGWNFEFVREP